MHVEEHPMVHPMIVKWRDDPVVLAICHKSTLRYSKVSRKSNAERGSP